MSEALLAVTVLGSSSSIPRPGCACSSYLIEGGGRRILADFGSGSFSNLRLHREPDEIDAIVISHMHADHFLDIIPMRYALKYGRRRNANKVKLYLPPDGAAMLHRLAAVLSDEPAADFLGECFQVEEYDPSVALRLHEAVLQFAPTRHYVPTFALRCSVGASSVTYSADTALDASVTAFARGTDLFFCEATLLPGQRYEGPPGHCGALDAGKMAHEAEVGRLVLTHYPAETDAFTLTAEARAAYAGAIEVATDNARLAL